MFPCTKCGACCLSVSNVGPLLRLGWVGEDGACLQYDRKARTCRIYKSRPTVCRIDEGRPVIFKRDHWTALNLEACDRLHLLVYGQEREQSGACDHVRQEEK